MSKNILIAFDESDNAQRAVEVVAQTFSRNSKVTLYSVAVDTEALCKMNSPELIPYFKSHQSTFCTMEDKKRELVDAALRRAKEILINSGFSEDAIQIKHETMDASVASDIIRESKDGYDIVAIGRRGTASIKEFFFGSTSQKVLQGAKDVSVFIVN